MKIRLLAPADAQAYHELRLRMLREHPEAFTSSFEEESAKPLSWVQERLAARTAPPAKVVLGAFSPEGRLLGSVGLSGEAREKQRHKAVLFGMFTATDARGQGVGKALLAECLEQARALRLEHVVLTVTEGNPAERLYAAAGFVRFGVEPRAIRVAGKFYGKVHMAWTPAAHR